MPDLHRFRSSQDLNIATGCGASTSMALQMSLIHTSTPPVSSSAWPSLVFKTTSCPHSLPHNQRSSLENSTVPSAVAAALECRQPRAKHSSTSRFFPQKLFLQKFLHLGAITELNFPKLQIHGGTTFDLETLSSGR